MSPISSPRGRIGVLLGVLAVAAAWAFWPKGGEPASPAPTSRSRTSLSRSSESGSSLPTEIPPLVLAAGRGETGKEAVVRNVFAFHVPPTPTPRPLPPTPTPFPAQGSFQFIGPRLPTPTPTATPIVPPSIPYKAIGMFGPREKPIVTFEEGTRLINAREGDILDGRFILKRVGRESVDFAFVGLPPDITRRIPVLPPEALR